jgi:hypothetical protein
MSEYRDDFYREDTSDFNTDANNDVNIDNTSMYNQRSFPNRGRPPMYSRSRHNLPRNLQMGARRQPRFDRPNFTPSGFMGGGHTLNDGMSNTSDFVRRRANARVPFNMVCFPLVCYNPMLVEEHEIKQMECSNRIIAPDSVIQQLCQYENIVSEHVFQINKSENRVSIGKYYTSATAEQSNAIYVPQYIFEGLSIEWGAPVTLNFINESIPKGTFARLQPLTNKITEVDDYQTYMQQHLQSNYTCLIQGQSIMFPCFDEQIIMIIHELQPQNIVSITNTDLAIDFEPSIEQREIEHQKEEELRKEQENAFAQLTQLKQKANPKTLGSDLVSFGKNMHKLNYDEINSDENYRNNNQEYLKHPNEPDTQSFVSFGGKGYVLSSCQDVTIESQPVSKPSSGFKLNFKKSTPNPEPLDASSNSSQDPGKGYTLGTISNVSSTLDGSLEKFNKGHHNDNSEALSMNSIFDVSKATLVDIRANRLKFLEKIEKKKEMDSSKIVSSPSIISAAVPIDEVNTLYDLDELDEIDILNTNPGNSLRPKLIPKEYDEKKKKFKIVLKKKNKSTSNSK